MFHLLYRHPKSPDESKILHSLWVIAGLSYRQRFEVNVTSIENTTKLSSEKKYIETLTDEIKATALYQSLSSKYQNMILQKIKEKGYLMKIEGGKVIYLTWQAMTEVIGIKPGHLQTIYTHLSFYSHPSNVSVFQFGQMFENNQQGAIELTIFNLMYAVQMLSIFLADFIYKLPLVKNSFDKLPVSEQFAMNTWNSALRGDAYTIKTFK